MTPFRRLSGWRIAALIFGALLLIGIGLTYEIRASADRAWKDMETRTRERIAQANAFTATRGVLRGTPEPGNAWELHDEALKLASGLFSPNITKLSGFAERAPTADRATAESLVAAHRSAILLLRRGTQRTDVTFRYDWEKTNTSSFRTVQTLTVQGLVALVVCEARLAREQGRPLEAARLLLDAAQFTNDIQRRGLALDHLIGISHSRAPLNELRLLVASRELAAGELDEVERELEILDRDWPLADIMQRLENLYFRRSLEGMDRAMSSNLNALSAWRFGFSPRLMIANAVCHHDRVTEELVRFGRAPWAEVIRKEERIRNELKNHPNPMAVWFGVGAQAIQGTLRIRLAQVRLLRTAARYRRDGTLLEVDDPFGAKLHHEVTGSKVRFWSVGRNAVDERGAGDWNDQGVSSAQDVVLEVER